MTFKILKFIFIITVIIILGKQNIYSVSPDPKTSEEKLTPSPTSAEIIDKLKKVEILKEKIATKVAEMRKEEKGAASGTVKEISKSAITIITAKGDRKISFLEDVTYYSLKENTKKETTAKIQESDVITVFGYYDQDKAVLSAKYIYFENPPLRIHGKIADIDKTNYTVTIKEKQGEVVIDVEKNTQTFLFDEQKKNFSSGGFSKMKVGDIVHILALPNQKTENKRVSANKFYFFHTENQPEKTPTEKTASPSATPVSSKKKE